MEVLPFLWSEHPGIRLTVHQGQGIELKHSENGACSLFKGPEATLAKDKSCRQLQFTCLADPSVAKLGRIDLRSYPNGTSKVVLYEGYRGPELEIVWQGRILEVHVRGRLHERVQFRRHRLFWQVLPASYCGQKHPVLGESLIKLPSHFAQS